MAGILKTLKHQLSKLTLWPPEVPESILAFSTITTILSFLRLETTFNDSTLSPPRTQRKQLKALNALATVLVMNTEAVAVTAKPKKDGRLEIIASVHLPEQLTITEPPLRLGHQLWNFLVTWSLTTIAWLLAYPHKLATGLTATKDVPNVIIPSPPSNLGDMGDMSQLGEYIDAKP